MSLRKQIIKLLFMYVLLFWGTLSTFAHSDRYEMDQQCLSKLYTTLSKLPSNKLVEMGKQLVRQRNEFDSAMVCFTIVTNRYKPTMNHADKVLCLDAYNNLGEISCYHYYDYGRAYEMLFQAKEIGEKYLPNNPLLCNTYNICGNMFLTSGIHYDSEVLQATSIDYFKKGLKKAYQLKDWPIYIKCYLYLSSFLCRSVKIEELKNCITEKEFKHVPETMANYKVFKNYYDASQFFVNGKYADSRKCLYSCLATPVASYMPHRFKTLTLVSIAHTYERENNLDSALVVYNRLLNIAEEHKMTDVAAATYAFIANDYQMRKDQENYIKYYRRYVQVKDSLLTVNGLENVGEKHFLTLVKQEADKATELHKRNITYVIVALFLIVIAIISTLLLIFVRKENRYLNERNKLLYERVHEMLGDVGDNACATKKYQNSSLSEEEKQKIKDSIDKVLRQPEIICQSTFTVDQLAQMVDSNSRYVSQVINECYGKNFSILLADERVKEACKRFDDAEAYGAYTIEAVAQSVGFRSRNSLITAFKRVTGLTPSEYQKVSKSE